MTKLNREEMNQLPTFHVGAGCVYAIEVLLDDFGPFRLSYSQDAGCLWRDLSAPTLAERDRAILALAAEGQVEISHSNKDVIVSRSARGFRGRE